MKTALLSAVLLALSCSPCAELRTDDPQTEGVADLAAPAVVPDLGSAADLPPDPTCVPCSPETPPVALDLSTSCEAALCGKRGDGRHCCLR